MILSRVCNIHHLQGAQYGVGKGEMSTLAQEMDNLPMTAAHHSFHQIAADPEKPTPFPAVGTPWLADSHLNLPERNRDARLHRYWLCHPIG